MYNYYRQGWVVGRLDGMAEKVFGASRSSSRCPTPNDIAPEAAPGGPHHLPARGPATRGLAPIRGRFAAEQSFWVNDQPGAQRGGQRLRRHSRRRSPDAAPERLEADRARRGRDAPASTALPTDDWPFLYLREPARSRR